MTPWTSGGRAFCWGGVPSSTLGDGVTTQSETPVRVQVPEGVATISAGYLHTCVLTVTGMAYCWGPAGSPLGAGAGVLQSNIPVAVTTTEKFSAISAGTTQNCALNTTHDAYCWGSGYGSLGIGARDTSCTFSASCSTAFTPQLVDGGLNWADISAGNAFSCGVTVDGGGYCWGGIRSNGDPYGPLGVLGSGMLAGSKSPIAVAGSYRFRTIRAGVQQACGATTDGTALCWGVNAAGAVGIGQIDVGANNQGTQTGRYASPQRVVGALRFMSVAAGVVSCGVSMARNLYCWGSNAGGLLGTGDATILSSGTLRRVAAPRP